MNGLQNKILIVWERERDNIPLWSPVCVGLGAAVYFLLPQEPPIWAVLTVLGAAIVGAVAFGRGVLYYFTMALVLAALGFGAGKLETLRAVAPVLREALNPRPVEGVVRQISALPDGTKYLLENVTIAGMGAPETPEYVRVTLKFTPENIQVGDRIRLRAGLFPPPRAALPGGFDFARYFYFQRIGAIGFGLAPIEKIATPAPHSFSEWFNNAIQLVRQGISTQIYASMEEKYASIGEGFITGETSRIGKDTYETIRQAGLAHLLAVSGMNLALVGGSLFFMVRLFIAAIPPLALRVDSKKIAASLSLLGSFFYLALSGFPVAAVRAFYMLSMLLVAILFDRTPSPIRAVAIAAMVILLSTPHEVLGAGFQLSFAATLGLIIFFDVFQKYAKRYAGSSLVLRYFLGLCAAAVVAGVATAPFTIYHFTQFATYGLIANIMAEPLVSLVIMPFAVAGMVLAPLGLAKWPFIVMGIGVKWLLAIVYWVTSLPNANLYITPFTPVGMAAIALGGLWCSLWRTRWRWWGLVPIILGCLTSLGQMPPDIIINETGRQIAVRMDGRHWEWVEGRAPNFESQQWMDRLGIAEFKKFDRDAAECSKEYCEVPVQGKIVAVVRDAAQFDAACAKAVVIIYLGDAPHGDCAAMLMDREMLEKHGTHAVWLTGQGASLRSVVSPAVARPWS